MDIDSVRVEKLEYEGLQRLGVEGAEWACRRRYFGRGRYKEGLGHFSIHVHDQEPLEIGVAGLTLERGDAHVLHFMGRGHSHLGGCFGDVLPASVYGRWSTSLFLFKEGRGACSY